MTEQATRTTLVVGAVKAPVALYRTTSTDFPDIHFDSAGPNGGKLYAVEAAKAVKRHPEADPTAMDPLAERPDDVAHEPTSETEPIEALYGRIIAEEGTGIEVGPDQVRKGVRQPDGGFIDLTDHLAAVNEATRLDEMVVEGFINVEVVERLLTRVTGSYWVAPGGDGYTLALIRAAMAYEEVCAVVRWRKRVRQSMGVIAPHPRGLVLIGMAWAELVREPRPEVDGVAQMQVRDEHLAMAVKLVQAMGEPAGLLDRLTDSTVEVKRTLRAIALDGKTPGIPVRERPEDEITKRLAESLA